MTWEVVIGLETHAQLSTASKIFSGASTAFGAPPNTHASAVDIALPGVLPVLNRGAVERAIRFGLAVGGAINRRSVFARKNYFYPDLPKGYQISQYEIPIVQRGSLTILTDEGDKTIRLTRAHLEEDAGKSLHEGLPADAGDVTGIDLNRAGTPLLEIVSEPDLRSSAEAIAYAKKLHELVMWIGICDGNMQEGSFRCDANVSVRRPGEPLGTRCEIKNLNSFRFMQQAIDYEVRRQIELIEDGGTVVQETRLYDPDRSQTRSITATSPILTCRRSSSTTRGSRECEASCRSCPIACVRAWSSCTALPTTMRRSSRRRTTSPRTTTPCARRSAPMTPQHASQSRTGYSASSRRR